MTLACVLATTLNTAAAATTFGYLAFSLTKQKRPLSRECLCFVHVLYAIIQMNYS